jgi:hypothetical protein
MSEYLSYDQLIAQNPELATDNSEWLRQRMGKFTASSFNKLLTPNYKPAESEKANDYILEKVAERLGAAQPQASSRAMSWGVEQEPFAIEKLKTIFTHIEANKEFILSEIVPDWAGATPDTIVYTEKGVKYATVQVKCPYNPVVHIKQTQCMTQLEVKRNLPEYYTQIVFEMWILGVDTGYFASFDPRFPEDRQLHLVRIDHDEEVLKVIKQVLETSILKVKSYIE